MVKVIFEFEISHVIVYIRSYYIHAGHPDTVGMGGRFNNTYEPSSFRTKTNQKFTKSECSKQATIETVGSARPIMDATINTDFTEDDNYKSINQYECKWPHMVDSAATEGSSNHTEQGRNSF